MGTGRFKRGGSAETTLIIVTQRKPGMLNSRVSPSSHESMISSDT